MLPGVVEFDPDPPFKIRPGGELGGRLALGYSSVFKAQRPSASVATALSLSSHRTLPREEVGGVRLVKRGSY